MSSRGTVAVLSFESGHDTAVALVGTLVLARAVDDEDLSNEILRAAAASLRLPEAAAH